MVLRSPELLEYRSDHDAESVTNPGTDQSYQTPMCGASPMIPETLLTAHEKSPAEDHIEEAGTLVPIREVDEIEDVEVSEVPQENMEPIPVREQSPPYIPVVAHGNRIVEVTVF